MARHLASLIAGVVSLAASVACAQTIPNLPAATTPLSGSELVAVYQSSATKKATVSDIRGAGGGGTVTSVTCGTGLTGGTITGAGTCALSTPVTTARGGTGVTTTPSNGQLLIGNGSGYTAATITAGSNVTVTNSAGGITIASTASGGGLTNVYDASGCTVATSTSSADAAPCIQAFLDTAGTAGGGVVWVGSGFRNLKSQLVAKQNVTLQCASNGADGDASLETYGNLTPGTVFAVLWGTGAGASDDPTKAAIQQRIGSAVKDCGWWYPSQSNTAVTPTEYGATILAYDTSLIYENNQVATGNWCAKCYSFIDYRGSVAGVYLTGPIVENNYGGPLYRGISVNYYADWGQPFGYGNHFNSGQINESDTSGSFLRGWVALHGQAFYVGHSDWILMQAPQVWGYYEAIELDFATVCCGAYVAHGPVIIQNGQLDACTASCIDVAGQLLDLRILGTTGTAFNQFSLAASIFLGGQASANIGSLTMADGYTFASMQNVVNLGGAATVGDVSISNWHTANAGSAQYAFEFPTGSAITSLYMSGVRAVGYAGGLYYPSTFTNTPTVVGSF